MRCYRGAPDKELQARLDSISSARMDAVKNGMTVTFFPAERQYMAFKEYKSVSGFHNHPRQALEEALR